MQTIRPAKKQLFCRPTDKEIKTASGILLTSEVADAMAPKTAEVINRGIEVKQYHPNDIIVYKSYTTTDIKLGKDEYFLIAEDDVLGTVLEIVNDDDQ